MFVSIRVIIGQYEGYRWLVLGLSLVSIRAGVIRVVVMVMVRVALQ